MPLELEKEIICGEMSSLTKDQRIEILKCIKNYNSAVIQRFSDGSRIDLDNLPDTVVLVLYNKIKYFLKI